MKYAKYAAYVLGGLLLVAVAVAGYIAATFDPNAYKGQITGMVEAETHRTLNIDGDIRLSFFPKIGMRLGQTRLSEFRSDREFAGVDDVRISLALLPLLRKEVVVDEIVIDGLRARLVRGADGSTNIDDLLRQTDAEESAPEPAVEVETGDSPPMRLEIDGVRITNAAFSYRDEQAGAEYAVSGLQLKTGRVAPGVPTRFEFAAQVGSNQPALDLHTRASGTLVADLANQLFELQGLRAGVEGSAAELTALDITLAADVSARTEPQDVRVSALRLEASGQLGQDRFTATVTAPRIGFAGDELIVEQLTAVASGAMAGIELADARLTVPKLDLRPAQQQVLIDGLTLSARGRQDANAFELKLDAPQLAITPERASGAAIVAALKAQGPQLAADANLRLSAVEGSAKALRVAELVFDLDARQAENAIKGRLSTPLSANLEAQTIQLSRLAGAFDLRSPELPAKQAKLTIDGSAEADLKRETVNADITSRFDESNIKAKLGLDGFERQAMRFDIAIDRLNVDRYLPQAEKTATKPAAGAQPQPDEPFDLTALKTLNLNGSLRAGELIASNVKASNVRVDVKAAEGKVEVNPLSANLYQGSANGAVVVDANSNRFEIRQMLTGVSIGPLMMDALEQDLLEGRGDVRLDVTTAGNTMSALKRALNGSARLALKDGAIKGINLGQAFRSARNLLSAKRDAESTADNTQRTDFSELTASFTIRNGVARNEDLDVKSPFVRLTGAGEVDIAGGSLDYVARAAVVGTASGQGGADLAELRGLTVPVRVSGPFDALKYKLEFGSAIADTGRQQLEQKTEALKERVEDKLRERLLGPKTEPDAAAPGEEPPPDAAQPQAKPEEELKKRLRDLLR